MALKGKKNLLKNVNLTSYQNESESIQHQERFKKTYHRRESVLVVTWSGFHEGWMNPFELFCLSSHWVVPLRP